jgi:putative flippase GtrA
MTRWRTFVAVGALGFVAQVAALAALTSLAHWHWLPATIVSVELAVLHNFFWHQHWTWRDRGPANPSASRSGERLLRFHLSNGIGSITGNAALMALLVGGCGMPAVPANVVSVALMAIANFRMADRWVFAALLLLVFPGIAAAAPPLETLHAWERYVRDVESRFDVPQPATPRADVSREIVAAGASTHVPSGTISDWRGSVFILGITLDRLLHGLQHPGTPPPQDDVVSSRVLSRGADSLQVAIRLVRRTIVTVTYDTEHHMRFRRQSAKVAEARSVATRIEQVGGSDHGFLWQLHSYWRYEEIADGVLVDLRSLTLSRNVPALLRPVAAPLVNRVARESMIRTLDALRRFYSAAS